MTEVLRKARLESSAERAMECLKDLCKNDFRARYEANPREFLGGYGIVVDTDTKWRYTKPPEVSEIQRIIKELDDTKSHSPVIFKPAGKGAAEQIHDTFRALTAVANIAGLP